MTGSVTGLWSALLPAELYRSLLHPEAGLEPGTSGYSPFSSVSPLRESTTGQLVGSACAGRRIRARPAPRATRILAQFVVTSSIPRLILLKQESPPARLRADGLACGALCGGGGGTAGPHPCGNLSPAGFGKQRRSSTSKAHRPHNHGERQEPNDRRVGEGGRSLARHDQHTPCGGMARG